MCIQPCCKTTAASTLVRRYSINCIIPNDTRITAFFPVHIFEKNGFMLISMEHNKASVCVLHTLLFKKKHPSLIECIFFWNTKPNLVIVLHKLNNQALKREHKYLFISVWRIPLIRKKNNQFVCCCWLLLIVLWRIINLSESIPYTWALTLDWEANMLWSLWWKLVLVKTVITAILISVKCFFASLLCHNVASCEHSLKCYCAAIKCHSH